MGTGPTILATHSESCFSIIHFDGYATVLINLPDAGKPELDELIVDAWLVYAPPALAEHYLAQA